MKNKRFQRLFGHSLHFQRQFLTLIILITFTSTVPVSADIGGSVFFILRHAEKTAAADDPALSPAGIERANMLASMLANAGITAIHSTDYKRTRATLEPLARRTGLTTRLYDPAQPQAFLLRLLEEGGRHVIAGHSNTVPEMVELLGGDPGSEIDEEGEFDRLYIITVLDGQPVSVFLRYGNTFTP